MDAFRKQLDELMGANRNGDVLEVKRNYWDRDVCRLYLTGLCPHDLFQLTVNFTLCTLLFSFLQNPNRLNFLGALSLRFQVPVVGGVGVIHHVQILLQMVQQNWTI